MTPIRSAVFLAAAIALPGAATVAAQRPTAPVEPAPAGMILMAYPELFGDLERPPVNFNHALHSAKLGPDQCKDCHVIENGRLTPSFAAAAGILAPDDLMDAYHGRCLGCHQQRLEQHLDSGPVTCGECHRRRNTVMPEQAPMKFDYSLHARHVAAFADRDENDQCRSCHHVYDETSKQLVYVKGQEDACSDCHLEQDEGKTLSLQNASHVQCLSCHLERAAEGNEKAGPTTCVGCHDPAHREAVVQLEVVPRLVRGQPDQMWIHRADGPSRLVAFDHAAHEPRTAFCTSCHHLSLQSCSTCHTVAGAPEGGGVTLEDAYHGASSALSCVGCHRREQAASACAGCHGGMATNQTDSACTGCHEGPWVAPGAELPAAAPDTSVVAPLPPSSDDFPETVVIDVLSSTYEPSTLPHRKMMVRLDEAVRKSRLASVLHGNVEISCEGCHHHSESTPRPPQCRACHGEAAQAGVDRPGLKVAYHRQCIGCHQRMGIDKLGCTDCHAAKETVS
jgi:hypothetical protein